MATTQKRLDELGLEGWLIVNCWPCEQGNVAFVMKRDRSFISAHTHRIEAARPLAELNLDSALEFCMRFRALPRKNKEDTKPPIRRVALSAIAKEFGAATEQALTRLKSLGFDNKGFAHVAGYWLLLSEYKGAWWLLAGGGPKKPVSAAKTAKARKASAKETTALVASEYLEEQEMVREYGGMSVEPLRSGGQEAEKASSKETAYKPTKAVPAEGIAAAPSRKKKAAKALPVDPATNQDAKPAAAAPDSKPRTPAKAFSIHDAVQLVLEEGTMRSGYPRSMKFAVLATRFGVSGTEIKRLRDEAARNDADFDNRVFVIGNPSNLFLNVKE